MQDPIQTYQMTFDGNILQRGFWLYIWKIDSDKGTFIYVGRTGDSSSANAASPFNRIGQHLNFKKNAKGNSIAKRLKEKKVKPKKCQFSMMAFGPLEEEVKDFEAHKPIRDKMASYEYLLAAFLREKKYNVLGVHRKGADVDEDALSEIKKQTLAFLESK